MVCLGLEFGASGWFLGADESTELWRAPKNPLISRRSPDERGRSMKKMMPMMLMTKIIILFCDPNNFQVCGY